MSLKCAKYLFTRRKLQHYPPDLAFRYSSTQIDNLNIWYYRNLTNHRIPPWAMNSYFCWLILLHWSLSLSCSFLIFSCSYIFFKDSLFLCAIFKALTCCNINFLCFSSVPKVCFRVLLNLSVYWICIPEVLFGCINDKLPVYK